jgi:hypothetical protein
MYVRAPYNPEGANLRLKGVCLRQKEGKKPPVKMYVLLCGNSDTPHYVPLGAMMIDDNVEQ